MKKAKDLVKYLIDNKSCPVSLWGCEQYGTKRMLYLKFPDMDARYCAELILSKTSYSVNRNYWAGKPMVEVCLGHYNSKYDGQVEIRNEEEIKSLIACVNFKQGLV